VKDNETATMEAVQSIQQTVVLLQKVSWRRIEWSEL